MYVHGLRKKIFFVFVISGEFLGCGLGEIRGGAAGYVEYVFPTRTGASLHERYTNLDGRWAKGILTGFTHFEYFDVLSFLGVFLL